MILQGVEQRLRLWGVDAAEKDEQGFQEARIALIGMVEGKRVSYIEIDRDRYKRIVARVFIRGEEVQKLMLKAELVTEVCRYSRGFYGQCKA